MGGAAILCTVRYMYGAGFLTFILDTGAVDRPPGFIRVPRNRVPARWASGGVSWSLEPQAKGTPNETGLGGPSAHKSEPTSWET